MFSSDKNSMHGPARRTPPLKKKTFVGEKFFFPRDHSNLQNYYIELTKKPIYIIFSKRYYIYKVVLFLAISC